MTQRTITILITMLLFDCADMREPINGADAGERTTDAGTVDAGTASGDLGWRGGWSIAWSCFGASCDWQPSLLAYDQVTFLNVDVVFWQDHDTDMPVLAPLIFGANDECATIRLMFDDLYQSVICRAGDTASGYIVHNQDPALIWRMSAERDL